MVSWTQTFSLCFVLLHTCYVQYHGTRYFQNYFGQQGLWPRAVEQLSDVQEWYRCTDEANSMTTPSAANEKEIPHPPPPPSPHSSGSSLSSSGSSFRSSSFRETSWNPLDNLSYLVRPMMARVFSEKELALLASWNSMAMCLQSSWVAPTQTSSPLTLSPSTHAAAGWSSHDRLATVRGSGSSGGGGNSGSDWMMSMATTVWDQSPRWMDWSQTWIMTRKFAYQHQRAFELKRLQLAHMFQEFSLEVEDFVAQTNWLTLQFLYLCSHVCFLLYRFEQESARTRSILSLPAATDTPPALPWVSTSPTTSNLWPFPALLLSSSIIHDSDSFQGYAL